MEFNPVSSHNLSRQIADQIREAIVNGSLSADDRLPTEEELARRFSVSRPTIREALKRLAAQNLVRSKRGPSGGTFINRPNLQELGEGLSSATRLLVGLDSFSLQEIIQCRLELEQLCAKLACQARREEELELLSAALERQRQTRDTPEAFCDADVAFHRTLANASGNPLLALLMHAVIEALQPASNMVVFRYPERDLIIAQHEALLAALRARDPERAQLLIQQQVDTLAAQLQRAREERQTGAAQNQPRAAQK